MSQDNQNSSDDIELHSSPRRQSQVDLDMTTQGKIVIGGSRNNEILILFVSEERGFSLSVDHKGLEHIAEIATDTMEALTSDHDIHRSTAWHNSNITYELRTPITHHNDSIILQCMCHTCPGGLCQLVATPPQPDHDTVRLSLHNNTDLYAITLTPPQRQALATHLLSQPTSPPTDPPVPA